MAKAVTEMAVGGLAIGAAFALPGMGIALTATMKSLLIGMGSSVAMTGATSGLAALMGNHSGIAVGVSSPVGPWGYLYGRGKVGGIKIFEESNNNGLDGTTSNHKQLHRVYALAAHQSSLGNWQLRVDGKQVLMRSYDQGFNSYSPTQIEVDIVSVERSSGLVTVHFETAFAGQDGLPVLFRSIKDNTFNGTFVVTQPDPTDSTTYTYVCGGTDGSSTGGSGKSTYADYKDKIYVDFLDGTQTSSFPKLLQAGTSWSESDLCLGHTVAYLQLAYDSGVFPSSIPNVSWVMDGKNDIYDPRTRTKTYTNNAALCIADYMSLPRLRGGFGLSIGADIPTDALIAAANVCDEAVALNGGGTEPRYSCNTYVSLNQSRGKILQDMLSSCAGRLSYQGGTYNICPGAWVAPTLDLTDADLVGPLEWSSRHSIRDTCNGVKGTYTSPENDWQLGDFPAFQCDYNRGYGAQTDPGEGDAYLVEDGLERIYKEVHFPCTTSSSAAQRLAKIELIRTRYQGRGKLRCSARAYQAVALDTITMTHPRYQWQAKTLEVLQSDLVIDTSSGAPRLTVELSVAETGSDIYDWSTAEQLSPMGYKYTADAVTVSPPEQLTLYSGPGETVGSVTYPSTITTSASGIERNSLYVSWVAPNDYYVTDGGKIELQWQLNGSSAWNSMSLLPGSSTSAFVTTVSESSAYNVRVRAINRQGVASDWVTAGPATVTDTTSTITVSASSISGTIASSSLGSTLASLVDASSSTVTPTLGAVAQVGGTGANISVSGSASAGTITLTTGAGTLAAGTICTLTFGSDFSSAPSGLCAANGGTIAGLGWSTTTTTLTLTVSTALAASTTYQIGYSLS